MTGTTSTHYFVLAAGSDDMGDLRVGVVLMAHFE